MFLDNLLFYPVNCTSILESKPLSICSTSTNNFLTACITFEDGSLDDVVELIDSGRRPVDKGSLQRARTAWTTSIGHDRLGISELDQR